MTECSKELNLSVIVPCYNEQDNLREMTRRTDRALRRAGVEPFEIILIDDASEDRTGEVIESLAEEYAVVVAVRHPSNRGIVGGWRSGLEKAHGRVVLTTDADLQYAPEDIPLLYRECVEGDWDLVQGWRKGHDKRHPLRDTLSVGLSGILRVLFSMRLRDVKSGFIAYRREVLQDILEHRFHYYSFQSLPTVAAQCKGYRITQLPITFHERVAGESFIKRPFIFSIRAAMDLPKAFLEYRVLTPAERRRAARFGPAATARSARADVGTASGPQPLASQATRCAE